jgi:hypothetical protein
MNPKLAKKFEEAITVTASSLAGGAMSFWLTGSFFHAVLVTVFCCTMFIWIMS